MNLDAVFEKFPVITGNRIELKEIEVADLEDVFAIYNNDRVFEYCGIIPKHNIDTVKNMIGHFKRDYAKKTKVKWGIYHKDSGNKLVGLIEAFDFNPKVNMVTIGYFLEESFWGKGMATEAVSLLIRFLFESAHLNRIQAEVMPVNDNSKRVLLKNGFRKEGTIRQGSVWAGKGLVDLEIYAILKEDYATPC